MRDWLDDESGVYVPDEDSLRADITGPTHGYDSNTRLKLERKKDLNKRGLRSPDEGDALALTYASIVHFDEYHNTWRRRHEKRCASTGNWMAF